MFKRSERPSLQERHDRIVLGLADVNKYIMLLEKSYERTRDEFVFVVLNDLKRLKASVWEQEDEWREQEEEEAFFYFDELPHAVRLFLTDQKLR